jgi:ABC-type multidrug transport system fused ATPase/permease subunit
MNQLSPDTQAMPFEQAETRGSTWKVYRRLMACAWAYKGRLMLSLFFALVIAASFSSIVVGVGAVIDLTFYQAEYKEDGTLRKVDPADRYAQNIQDASAKLEQMIGWAPRDWDTRFKQRVLDMRKNSMGALIGVSIVAIVLSIIIGVARFLQEYYAGAIGANISADLAEAMYANLMRQSLGFFELRSSGDILARFTNDVFMVNRGLSGVFVKLMREPFKAIMFIGIAICHRPLAHAHRPLRAPGVAYTIIAFGKKTRRSTRRSLQKIASMATVVNETISGMAIVKGFNMEQYEIGRVKAEVGPSSASS